VTHHSASDVLLDGAHEEVGSASSAAVALPDPPPEWVIVSLAQQLQQRLGLQLFNFDLLRPLHSRGPRLYCIDVNYFPGYEKLPGSVPRMLGFMGAVLRGELADGRYGKDSYATCIQLTHQAHPE
jgi:inositol-1,3,4-trisphosphate 5/6-kinase/inositol-tetrakisphosphate 1-kinase